MRVTQQFKAGESFTASGQVNIVRCGTVTEGSDPPTGAVTVEFDDGTPDPATPPAEPVGPAAV